MPRVTVENDEQVPVGAWPARLIAVKAMPPSEAHPDWGASYVWEFEVTAGTHRGKRCSCFTKQNVTPLNNLGRLLVDLLGRALREGEGFELESFVGKEYTIKVGPNKTGDKTRVNAVFPAQTPAPPGNGPVADPARPAAGPPPRKPHAAAPAAPPPVQAWESYWVANGDATDPVKMTYAELQDWVAAEHLDPAAVEVAKEGEDEWRSAKDFGIADTVPW
jgi:hypothetical protein